MINGDFSDGAAQLDDSLRRIGSTLHDILRLLQNRRQPLAVGEWLFVLILVFLSNIWAGSRLDRFTDRLWYTAIYDVDWKDVNISRRPTECDFFHAPIGSKGCSYHKTVEKFTKADKTALLRKIEGDVMREEVKSRPTYAFVNWGKKEEP